MSSLKVNDLVELPRHLRGPRVYEHVGRIELLFADEDNILDIPAAIVQVYRGMKPYGNPVLIPLEDLKRKRLHLSCPTCECGIERDAELAEEEADEEEDNLDRMLD